MNRYLAPLVVFIVLVLIFRSGLDSDPGRVPSPLIDKSIPYFSLPALRDPAITVSSRDLYGQITLLNVWASWCIACRDEHPVLVELTRKQNVRIYGLNYKDTREEAIQWLDQYGDPYVQSVFDQNGRVGIDFGVYGVPETFVLDSNGIIRYKLIGPITQKTLDEIILPLLQRLEQPAS